MKLTEYPVVVTGGAGMIGSHLVRALYHDRGIVAAIYDNLERRRAVVENDKSVGYQYNIAAIPGVCNTLDLATNVPTFPDGAIVFHLAAKVAGIQYNATHHYRMAQRNLAITLNVLEAARECRSSLLVYVSTACVYGHDAPVPTPESAADGNPEPTNRGYGLAKWMGEQLVQMLHAEYGIPAVIVRLFNAIGPGDYYDPATSHVVPALIRRVMEGEDPLRVWGSGNQTRSFVDARDIARALVLLAECDAAHDAQPVNIGHEHEVTIRELAYSVADACEEADLRILFDTTKPDGHPRRAPDITRLRSLIGWVPDTPLGVTLMDMVREYREGRAHE